MGLYRIDGGAASTGNKVINNTIRMASGARWAVNIQNGSTGNILRNNILLGLDRADDEIYRATKLAVMERDLEQLNDNLETMVGGRGVKLSGGQAQRTAAARMFIREPELLVFDDLSSALDVETEQQLRERILNRKKRKPVSSYHIAALFSVAQTTSSYSRMAKSKRKVRLMNSSSSALKCGSFGNWKRTGHRSAKQQTAVL